MGWWCLRIEDLNAGLMHYFIVLNAIINNIFLVLNDSINNICYFIVQFLNANALKKFLK